MRKKRKKKEWVLSLGAELSELLKTRYSSKVKGSAKVYNRNKMKRKEFAE